MSVVDLTVVVPAYNEEQRLGPTLEAIRAYLSRPASADPVRDSGTEPAEPATGVPAALGAPGRWGTWELIVVDDGSSDRTREIAAEAAARDARVHVVASDRNRGKGHALRLGVLSSYGRRVLVTDADLASPIDEFERLDAALTADPDVTAAIGSRAGPGAAIEKRQHRLRELLGRTGNFLIRSVAVPGVRDTQCGFKLFDGDRAREAFAASRLRGWGIDIEILQYFRRAGWPLTEVPVRWSHQEGSKVRPLDYAKVLGELAVLKARPWAGPAATGSGRRSDLLAAVLFVALASLLYVGRWIDPNGHYLPDSLQDQNQWEWFFAVTADNVQHLRNPLFSTLQNFPDGVNLMANTVMLGLSVPLAPVTWLFGPAVSLSLVMTLGLAGTAWAWYWLISRRLVRSRGAAAVGAALAAFAPPMISHAHAHPNFIVLFMIPLIVDRALRLCPVPGGPPVRVGRDGAILGLFAAYQVFLGEEPLLLAVMGMLLFTVAYALARPDVAKAAYKPLLKGLGVGVAVALPIVAFPLYWQFFGPQSYHSVLHGEGAGNSPLALLSFAERSLAGDRATADALSMNPTEQNAFYGWPLAAVAFAIVVRLRHRPVVRALAATVLVAAILSLGTEFRIPLTDIVLPGPWRLLAHQPLFESVIESRVAMICAPALGMLIALALEPLLSRRPRAAVTSPAPSSSLSFPITRPVRLVGLGAVACALLPIVPLPLETVDRAPVPKLISGGGWQRYVDVRAGESLVPVPLPDPGNADALHWQTAAGMDFPLPGGYFNGPYGEDRTGIYGAVPRNTSDLLRDVRYSGRVPQLSPEWQQQAREDFAYWNAGALVLGDQPNDAALYETVEQLVGRPGTRVGGAWVWDLPAPMRTGG